MVEKAQLINVGRDLRVVDGLERTNDIRGQLLQFLRRDRRARRGRHRGRPGRAVERRLIACLCPRLVHCLTLASSPAVPQAKKSCALISASASASTSALVLYMAKEARQVAVTPSRCISGWAQWWPARTATPERSIMVEMSCGCRPSMPKATMAPLSAAVP